MSNENKENNDVLNGVEIENSHLILTPWVQYLYSFWLNYINHDTRNLIEESSFGVQYEWLVHNIAYCLFYGNESIKGRASPLNLGRTVFSNQDPLVRFFFDVTYPVITSFYLPFPVNVVILAYDIVRLVL